MVSFGDVQQTPLTSRTTDGDCESVQRSHVTAKVMTVNKGHHHDERAAVRDGVLPSGAAGSMK